MVFIEEGDVSAINQPYDQQVAKSDKQCIRELLDMVRYKVRMISQFDFIAICVKAFVKVKSTYWVKSFFKENLHPDFHIDFVDWLKRIDKSPGWRSLFKPSNNNLLETMPAFWQKLSCEARHAAVGQIDTFYECALPSESVWKKKENLWQLQNYCSIEHISMLRACLTMAKIDESVFLEAQPEAATTTTHSSTHTIDQFCEFTTWKSTSFMQNTRKIRAVPSLRVNTLSM
jgi:hypothetical protein